MQVKTFTNYIHIAPQKIRLAADLIRGLNINEAESQLLFSKKQAACIILKSLKSATASAIHNFSLEKNNLYISKIQINEGPSMKRWRAAAFGSAHSITKRTSHMILVLDERVKSKKKTTKKEEISKKEEPQKQDLKKEKQVTEEKSKKWHKDEKEIKKITHPKQKMGLASRIFRRKSG